MPYHDEEYPGQPLWQSVLLFCCKGMIEGIMVVLFFWLLVQVLFTKQLEVHLQILLLVGLIVFCLCLILGCILCWRKSYMYSPDDKEPVRSAPAPAPAPVAAPAAAPPAPVTLAQSQSPSAALVRQQYEELDGDILEYPSTFSSPARSEAKLASLFSVRGHAASGLKEHPKSYFPLRRLSTPCTSSPYYKPMNNHASSPSLPKLGLLSRTRRVLQRRSTVTGDGFSYSEHSRLTSPGSVSPSNPEEPIPLAHLHYGSSASCRRPASPAPCLHFTMAFSPEQHALTVTMLSLTGTSHRLEDVSVLGSLAPLCPCPVQASVRCGLSPEPSAMHLVLKVGTVEELQRCVLRLALYTRDLPSLRGSPLGELEVQCVGKDWKADHPFHCTKELSPNKWRQKTSLTPQNTQTIRGLSCPPQILGQLFILLQYQTLAHRIKAMVLRADNLTNLSHTPDAPDYQVVINLHHDGVVIVTRKIESGSSIVWNTPFLFDLPPGDINQLALKLEFIVIQNDVHSKSPVLGRVLIGSQAPEAGRAHWKDMCSQGQVERARWHSLLPEPL